MTDHEQLLVEVSVDAGAVHIRLVGDLDIATTDHLLNTARPFIDEHVTEVVIDAAELAFMDSTGIGALLRICKMGAPVVVSQPSDRMKRLLELIVLNPALTFRD